jgi:hypothetical protein
VAKQLGPLDLVCEAPPYPIVKACAALGFRNPEDVRWCHVGQFLGERPTWAGTYQFLTADGAVNVSLMLDQHCSCGRGLPPLELYTFLLATGEEVPYFLGQCPRCRTLFWEHG